MATLGQTLSTAQLAVVPGSPPTFTQTYATATTTVPAITATVPGLDLTQVVTSVTALVADVTENRKLINALIDALQAAGIAL